MKVLKGTGTADILRLLESKRGQWAAAPELSRLSLAYTRCVHELRHDHGFTVENRTARVKGKVHGFYRIPAFPGQPAPPLPCSTSDKPTAVSKTEGKAEQIPSKSGNLFRDIQSVRDFCSFEMGAR